SILAPFIFRLKSPPSCLIGSRHTRGQVIARAELTLLGLHIDVIQVHIVLHRTDILVPQHLLKAEDVPSKHEVPYGEGMPEDMRCDPAVREVGTLAQTLEEHLDAMHGEGPARLRQKDVVLTRISDFFKFPA